MQAIRTVNSPFIPTDTYKNLIFAHAVCSIYIHAQFAAWRVHSADGLHHKYFNRRAMQSSIQPSVSVLIHSVHTHNIPNSLDKPFSKENTNIASYIYVNIYNSPTVQKSLW